MIKKAVLHDILDLYEFFEADIMTLPFMSLIF